jgi:outer membrane biosynthesis protein TonB
MKTNLRTNADLVPMYEMYIPNLRATLSRTEKPVFVFTDEDGVFEGYEIGDSKVIIEPTPPVETPPEMKRDKFNTRVVKRQLPPPMPKPEPQPKPKPKAVQAPPKKPITIAPEPKQEAPVKGLTVGQFVQVKYFITDCRTNRHISETTGIARELVEKVRQWCEEQKRKPCR